VARQGLIDRLLGRRAPEAKKATVARPRISRGARAEYDGATQGKRAAGWRRTRLDANSELSPSVQALLRGIARDLVRNNPFAARGAAKIAEAIVGTGITFQVYRGGKVDDRLNKLARRHFDKPTCDAAGRHDLYGLQLQAARTIVESGAALVRRRWRRAADGLPLPFQLQVLEPDYLDQSKHGQLASAPDKNGGFCIHGIQFDPIGRREGYWLYNGHPGSSKPLLQGSTFIPAGEIAHVFRADRPEQEHGATWFAPVILRSRDFADYEDAQLTRQKLAAAFVGVVHGEDLEGNIPGIVTEGEEGAIGADPIDEREPLDYVEPGTFQYLRDGEQVTFSKPPTVEGYADYSKVSLRAISVGLGVPYEVLTGDLSGVSFISGRLGRLEYRDTVAAWQWLMFIPQLCGSVERWFFEALELAGEDTTGLSMRWTPTPTKMLDPATEVAANRDAIRSGQMTISSAARERGEDPDTFLAEWAEDARRLDALGLIFDSDPRKVTAVGNPASQAEALASRKERDTP
jgi:lambda family phage portal protein